MDLANELGVDEVYFVHLSGVVSEMSVSDRKRLEGKLLFAENHLNSCDRKLILDTFRKIEVKSKGSVRRAKLYYLRKLTGRKAKITEDRNNLKGIIKKKEEKLIEKKLKNTEKNIEKSKKKSSDIKETKDNNKNKED